MVFLCFLRRGGGVGGPVSSLACDRFHKQATSTRTWFYAFNRTSFVYRHVKSSRNAHDWSHFEISKTALASACGETEGLWTVKPRKTYPLVQQHVFQCRCPSLKKFDAHSFLEALEELRCPGALISGVSINKLPTWKSKPNMSKLIKKWCIQDGSLTNGKTSNSVFPGGEMTRFDASPPELRLQNDVKRIGILPQKNAMNVKMCQKHTRFYHVLPT